MNLKARIEKLETRRADADDTITLGDLVAASYMKEGDPRLAEFKERYSRSRLGRLLSESLDRGSDAFAGGSAGEVNQERGGAHV